MSQCQIDVGSYFYFVTIILSSFKPTIVLTDNISSVPVLDIRIPVRTPGRRRRWRRVYQLEDGGGGGWCWSETDLDDCSDLLTCLSDRVTGGVVTVSGLPGPLDETAVTHSAITTMDRMEPAASHHHPYLRTVRPRPVGPQPRVTSQISVTSTYPGAPPPPPPPPPSNGP